jgi:hypothetical protein
VLGAGYHVRGGTVFVGQLAVRGRPFPVVLYVAGVGVGEDFVKPCGPVMRAGGMKAHVRCAPEGFQRPYAGHARRRSRLRDVVRSRAGRPARLKVGRPEAGRQLSISLVQIADSLVKFSRSPRPAGHALRHPISAFHVLVVSQPSVFHKDHGRLTGPRGAGGEEHRAGRIRPGLYWRTPRRNQHALVRAPAWDLCGEENAAGHASAIGWFVNRSKSI